MSDLRAHHDSQEKQYRNPFGARPCGDKVTLRLASAGSSPIEECSLCLSVRDIECEHRMEAVDPQSVAGDYAAVFETTVTLPQDPGLAWYYFRLKSGGRTYFYCNNRNELGGAGSVSREKGPPYQITVYKPSVAPRWFKEGIMYQIFVDRFFNPGKEALNPKKGSLIHAHWDDTPTYIRDENGKISRWAFFGGNLQGVIEKLSYLEELGITVIYFNPIFEAASSHKYDTGDYMKIDSMYGDMAAFSRLIQEAAKAGISVILDGVFSHTGADSRYFNKYGNYPELGAFQAEVSPYYPWFRLKRPGGEYECWWGEEDLPNVNELEPSYLNFMLGRENGVVRHWLREGTKGWRLDVADELPDEFIRLLRQAVKETDPEAVLIGEVWEDASNKVSYGERREYLLGDELDSVMNYPLREILLDFLLGTKTAGESVASLMSLYENYPPENFRAAMNLIGSHDRVRALTLLGEAPAEGSLSIAERESFRLSAPAREKGVKRLRLMALLQMMLPGVPCVYYGDEAGVEGYSDPYNRGPYPWGKEDKDLLEWHKRLVRMRKEYLSDGEFTPFSAGDDVLGFRNKVAGEEVIVCVNRNQFEEARVDIDTEADLLVLELLSGEKLHLDSSVIKSCLRPLEGKVFFCRPMRRRTARRLSGILLHITSLPSRWGIGDMGKEAERFVDFLASAGQTLWQILPLNPIGEGNSPYQSCSVMAGNTLLISPDSLHEAGLLTSDEVQKELDFLGELEAGRVSYDLAREVKERLFRLAWRRFRNGNGSYESFLSQNKYWLDDYCLFMALRKRHGGLSWVEWEKGAVKREPSVLAELRKEMAEEIEYQQFLQYAFFRQWENLKHYANGKGIFIVGDAPIYVAADSCDTWAHKRLFKLDEAGNPSGIAGVPPDYYSETGQLWGNPVYDWRQMEKDSYAWWKDRVRQLLRNYDYIRLDHFRGFEAFWEIPAGESARNGHWLKGPGKRFFEALEKEFGDLPFIVEDLGHLTPEVHNLRNIFGFPGTKVYQFEPENHTSDCVYYSGTHDNDTLAGWNPQENTTLTLENIYASRADWTIIPLQDILGLDSKSRMNTPGTTNGNWMWRMKGDLSGKSQWLRNMMLKTGRLK